MNTATQNQNPFLSAVPAFESKHDYNQCSFWCENHPLSAVADKLTAMVPHSGCADDVVVEVYRLAQNCYYDLYNNGGGNTGRWRMKRELKSAMRKAFTPEAYTETLKSYEALMKEMNRNCFPMLDVLAFRRMELFFTNVTYYCAQAKGLTLPSAAA